MKRTLNLLQNEEAAMEVSPEADAAMAELTKIFSDPNLPTKPAISLPRRRAGRI
jgi:hypothetical protein